MIKLDNEYYISSDGTQYILNRKYITQPKQEDKQGKEIISIEGYYSTLKGCAKGYYDKKVKSFVSTSEEQEFTSIVNYMRKIEDEIDRLIGVKVN